MESAFKLSTENYCRTSIILEKSDVEIGTALTLAVPFSSEPKDEKAYFNRIFASCYRHYH
ncbi:MAG: hypothetical protein CSA50_02500 [Gammaproteobacteria bacterium]|nr:MAG: hypothetical protein CSA50_02500 [Gammaproteobacteria bacterium]